VSSERDEDTTNKDVLKNLPIIINKDKEKENEVSPEVNINEDNDRKCKVINEKIANEKHEEAASLETVDLSDIG